MEWTMRNRRACSFALLIPLLVASAANGRGQAGGEPAQGVFVLQILEKEVGREAFELLPDGWRTKGSFDLFGRVKAEFEIVEKRAEGKTSLSIHSKQNDEAVSIEAVLSAERFETIVQGGAPKTLELAGR